MMGVWRNHCPERQTVDFTGVTGTRPPGWEGHQPGSISRNHQTYAGLEFFKEQSFSLCRFCQAYFLVRTRQNLTADTQFDVFDVDTDH